MLSRTQLRRWVDAFGVPADQIERDHLVSHVLARLPEMPLDATFFGGSALCRTHLPDRRLSEDIDLLVPAPARAAEVLADRLPGLLKREHRGLSLRWERDRQTLVGKLAAAQLVLRIQLVTLDAGYRRYPSSDLPVLLRYDDLPEAVVLRCPTRTGAAAMKLNAWAERAAARDLCDLLGLAEVNALDAAAVAAAAEAAAPLQSRQFDDARLPSEAAWQAALRNQMRTVPPLDRALAVVRAAVADAAGWRT